MMKNNKYKKIVQVFGLLIGLLLFSACDKAAKVKLPKVDKEIVIVSFICPQDSLIKVKLSLSQPLYNTSKDNAYKPLQDATVSISSILGTHPLFYSALHKCFVADSTLLKIRAGVNYVLTVSTPDGKKATASTTIPEQNTSLKLEISPLNNEFATYYGVKASWNDPAGQDNYYRLFLETSSYFMYPSGDQNGTYEDTIYTREVQDELMDDLRNPGGVLKNTYEFSFSEYSGTENYFCLLHLSKDYFTYHDRLYDAANSGNPFAEPVQMPTNVEGGFGVFAGYNMYRIKLEP